MTQTFAPILKIGDEFERILQPGTVVGVGETGWCRYGEREYFCQVLRSHPCPVKDRWGRACPRRVARMRVI